MYTRTIRPDASHHPDASSYTDAPYKACVVLVGWFSEFTRKRTMCNVQRGVAGVVLLEEGCGLAPRENGPRLQGTRCPVQAIMSPGITPTWRAQVCTSGVSGWSRRVSAILWLWNARKCTALVRGDRDWWLRVRIHAYTYLYATCIHVCTVSTDCIWVNVLCTVSTCMLGAYILYLDKQTYATFFPFFSCYCLGASIMCAVSAACACLTPLMHSVYRLYWGKYVCA